MYRNFFSLRFIFGVLVSLVALFWLISSFDLEAVWNIILSVEKSLLFPIPFLILLSFLLRAERWRIIIEHEQTIRRRSSFSALMIGYFLNNLLPARAGDIARALELSRTEKISRAKILATLVTERIFDLAATLILASLVLISYPALPFWLTKTSVLISVITFCMIIFLCVAHFTGKRWIEPIIVFFTKPLPTRVGPRISQIADAALNGVAGIFKMWGAVGFSILTILIWISEMYIVFFVANAIGLELALGNALFVLLFIAIGSMIPSSPGFVGTFEFFGVTALSLIGITGPNALASMVLLHLILLFGSSILGVMCLTFRQSQSNN